MTVEEAMRLAAERARAAGQRPAPESCEEAWATAQNVLAGIPDTASAVDACIAIAQSCAEHVAEVDGDGANLIFGAVECAMLVGSFLGNTSPR